MIEKGNMTDAEYIAELIAENKKLKVQNKKLKKKTYLNRKLKSFPLK